MPESFRHSAVYSVSRDVFGDYTVVVQTYQGDTLVDTKTYTFDDGSDEIVGIYQRQFPDTYNTIGDFPSSMNPDLFDVTEIGGLKLFAANCTNLAHTALSHWTLPESGPYHNEYAFYNCPGLYEVLTDSNHADYFDSVHYSAHMFEGDENLHYICESSTQEEETSVVFSFVDCLGYNKDMFKGCTALVKLKIRNGTGVNDITAPQTFEGIEYEHGYEYLGLTTEQFTNIVELVTE